MPETAAKPGGLYLILRGAFQDAEFESLQAHPLAQRALPSSVYNHPATAVPARYTPPERCNPSSPLPLPDARYQTPPRATTCRKG